MEKIYFGVDVGGSLTKTFTLLGDKEIFREKDNSILKHDNYINSLDYIKDEQDFDTKLDLNINIKNNPTGDFKLLAIKITDEINNNRWLFGELAKAVSPNFTKIMNKDKMKQAAYYLNIISSLVSVMKENNLKEVDVTLGVLLPAKQYFMKEKGVIKEILNGSIIIYNNITEENFIINIKDVIVKPEAVVAFNTVFFENGKLSEIGRDFISKFNVVVDIGENTTDIAAIRNKRPDPVTFHSFDYAGALLMNYFEREISRKLGYSPNQEELKGAFATGFLNLGAHKEWVGAEIENANREFAERLFRDFTQNYLVSKDIKLPQIASFLFIGGGSVKVDKVLSVYEIFMDLVKEDSKFTTSFSIPEIRLANIKGLSIILKQEKMKENN